MPIALIEGRTASSTFTENGPQHSVTRPASAVLGTYVVVEIAMAVLGTGITSLVTPPDGWTLITGGRKNGTPSTQGYIYGKVMGGSEPASWTWTFSVEANVVSHIHVHSGVDSTAPFVEVNYLSQVAGNTSRFTGSITTTAERFIRYGTHDRNGSSPVVPHPDTRVNTTQPSSASLTSAHAGTQPAGTHSQTMTGAVSTSVAGSFIYALNPSTDAPAPLPGWAVSVNVGGVLTPGRMLVKQGGELIEPVNVYKKYAPQGFVIQDLLADNPFYVAHRGGGVDHPEHSLVAYENAVAQGYKALEISVWRTIDGVWVANHDHTTTRMTGVAHNIYDVTWDTIKDLTLTAEFTNNPAQSRQPIARLEEILDLYANSHVIYLDDKSNVLVDELIDWIESRYNGTEQHFVFKTFKPGYAQAALAKSRGYTTWGIYYDNEIVTEPSRVESFDILGLNYNASGTNWTAVNSHGKPVMAHIVATTSQHNLGLTNGADGFMSSTPSLLGP